jgi:hypothetical protein
MKHYQPILALCLITLSMCKPAIPVGEPNRADPTFQTTCGDPVCSGFSPYPTAVLCTAEREGDLCTEEGAYCVIPNDACNMKLICSAEDPKDNGCSVSLSLKETEVRSL